VDMPPLTRLRMCVTVGPQPLTRLKTANVMNWLLFGFLLFQSSASKPRILMEPERVPLTSPEASFVFSGFSRADLMEVARAGKQEEASIGISSVSIRNHVVQHRQKSYTLDTQPERRITTLTFKPSDVRQDSVIVIMVPLGVRVAISMDGESIPTQTFQTALL